ncbi:adenosine deaminase [Serratia liquefaciens]|uniref:adenosine deaminase n=1 Tax=Serratia liquefaciens TaxID=614 RepID=UPI00217A2ADD|nr:adenosine deaminase [Serratia liquefaciens]CAI1149288.1 Adenine deaminase [Serratia liquefaciens]
MDDLFDQLHADNVIYAEIRFAPLLHANEDLSAEKVIETVLSAMQRCNYKYGVKSKLIVCTLRHFTKKQSLDTAKLAAKYLSYGVAALDLAADEARYSLDNHIAAFDYMHEMGGGCIAHAGEALGHASIVETINLLNVSRIGHGVNCIEDFKTVELLKSKNIHLEICPSCNIVCNVFGTIDEHPIDKIKKLGISMGVNTDARTVANTTLNNEYLLLNEKFGWEVEEFIQCNLSAIKASFIKPESKEFLSQKINSQQLT